MQNVEIERKYVIKLPDVEKMQECLNYKFCDITQVYMPSVGAVSHRIRRSVYGGYTKYTETKKMRIDSMSAYEDECEISEDAYEKLFLERDTELSVITKRRHIFEYGGQVFEIDVYPEWRESCIMETELAGRELTPRMPEFISVIAEVTGIRAYSNHSMAKKFPDELL